jgi:DNA polymerase-3 subunit epsilon
VRGIPGLLNFRKKRALVIDKEIPIDEARYVVIDTELTGLDEKRDSIVSMAAIRMVGGRIDFEDVFNMLVNPETALTAESVIIHGITPSEVIRKPRIEDVLAEFVQFCDNDILVGHCVSIDTEFINMEAKRIFGCSLSNHAIDTSAIYEWIRKRYSAERAFPCAFTDSGLFEIAKFFGIAINGAHNAVIDAFITAQLFQRFIPMLMQGGVKSIGDLLSVGNPSKGGDWSGATKESF